MFTRKMQATAVMAAVAIALTGCAGASGGGGDDSTLTIGVGAPATTLEAQGIFFGQESPYGQAIFDSLLRAAPDGSIEPWLATEWSYSEDLTVLTMTLRDDVDFTDGSTFDATAAAENLTRFKNGTSANSAYLASMETATAVDPATLEITLSEPDPSFLTYLTRNAGMIQAPSSFDDPDAATAPVGSGAYVVDPANTVTGTSYAFTANPDYWAADEQYYDRVVMNVYTDPTSLLNALQGGQINAARLPNAVDLPQVEAAGYTTTTYELDWVGLILFDRDGTLNPALGDVRVRQAINHAFDRSALLSAVNQDFGTETTQVFPTSSPGYDDELDEFYAYDPERAQELLAEAGYPDGFTLDMPSAAAFGTTIFTLLQQQLADIGISVNYTDAGNNFISDILAPKYAATVMQLEQQDDWQLINFELTPESTFNPFRNEDAQIAELVETIQYGSEDEREAASTELNAYVVEQAWFAPWYRVESIFVTDANTEVEPQTGNGYPYLWNITPAS